MSKLGTPKHGYLVLELGRHSAVRDKAYDQAIVHAPTSQGLLTEAANEHRANQHVLVYSIAVAYSSDALTLHHQICNKSTT